MEHAEYSGGGEGGVNNEKYGVVSGFVGLCRVNFGSSYIAPHIFSSRVNR